MEIGIMIEGQNGLNWTHWMRLAERVETLGFTGLYRSDHFTNSSPPDLDSLECWTSLTWLASHSERLDFGQLVSPSLGGILRFNGIGHLFVGIIILICSIILPIAKLAGLLTLSIAGMKMEHHHRAWMHRVIEFTGRWGMLDVLAVAVLVSAVKLGSSVELTAGPGALAFAVVVLLSLAASAVFDPHAFWENEGNVTASKRRSVET